MLNYLFSCFGIWINMSLIKRMTHKSEVSSNTPCFWGLYIENRRLVTHTHSHTHRASDVSVVKIWYLSTQNEQIWIGVGGWKWDHSTFASSHREASLFSHPFDRGCLVTALTNSLAKVTLYNFQAKRPSASVPRLLSPFCHYVNKPELAIWRMRPHGAGKVLTTEGAPEQEALSQSGSRLQMWEWA